jgi:prophage regulatory protein
MPRISNDPDPTDVRILRREQVSDRVGLSPAQIYNLVSTGNFPKPITLSANRVGWLEHEVTEWLKQRIAARDEPHRFRRGRRQPKRADVPEAAEPTP